MAHGTCDIVPRVSEHPNDDGTITYRAHGYDAGGHLRVHNLAAYTRPPSTEALEALRAKWADEAWRARNTADAFACTLVSLGTLTRLSRPSNSQSLPTTQETHHDPEQ